MGEFARALGMSETLEFKGKVYRLSPLSFEVFGLWEQYLEERAFALIERQLSRTLGAGAADDKQRAMIAHARREQALIAAIAAGDYGFFSEVSSKAQSSILSDGWKNMLRIRLQVLQPEVTPALVDEMVEEQADKILQLLRRLDTPDPNSPSPTVTAPEGASEPKPSSPASSKAA